MYVDEMEPTTEEVSEQSSSEGGVASPIHEEESSGEEESEETKNKNLKTMNKLREDVQKLAQKWDDKQDMFKECKTKHGCIHLIENHKF